VHKPEIRAEVLRRRAAGQTLRSIASDLGLAVRTVHDWTRAGPLERRSTRCWRCTPFTAGPDIGWAYAYLLGQYLGDGHLVTSARVPVLRIYSCTDYPGVITEIQWAVEHVRGVVAGEVCRANTERMRVIQSYWMHWPCLLPQHGPGRKHERRIELADWQRSIVAEHPWPLIRGLIHSDGCRAMNRVVVRGKRYS
jgi:hypothetical protein